MSARPWMPLYVGDYLSKTQRLTVAEHGAYMLLIMEYWQSGGLPDDDDQLSRIVRVTRREWQKLKPAVSAFFTDDWRHGRVEEELAKADRKHLARVESGREGGKNKARAVANSKQSASNATKEPLASSTARGLSQSQSLPSGEVGSSPLAVATFPNTAPSQASGAVRPQTEIASDEEIPASLDRRRYSADFEDLWAEYRPIASPNATKADAARAFGRLSAVDKRACWQGVVRYAQWLLAEREKRADFPAKHLATFINRRGWESFADGETDHDGSSLGAQVATGTA